MIDEISSFSISLNRCPAHQTSGPTRQRKTGAEDNLYRIVFRTVHQYLDRYPVSPDSERVVVGTIHPHDTDRFRIPFFYGSKLSLWELLDRASGGEIGQPITLEKVLTFLERHRIAMSDTVRECSRRETTWADSDLIPTRLNTTLLEQIRQSRIREVLFMSGFGKNNAFKLFYVDMLGRKIGAKIRTDREVLLEKEVFGRPVKLTVLYSPSGAANIALAQSEIYRRVRDRYADSPTPVYDFKVDYYREKFGLSEGSPKTRSENKAGIAPDQRPPKPPRG